jgi:hypothetical protein
MWDRRREDVGCATLVLNILEVAFPTAVVDLPLITGKNLSEEILKGAGRLMEDRN